MQSSPSILTSPELFHGVCKKSLNQIDSSIRIVTIDSLLGFFGHVVANQTNLYFETEFKNDSKSMKFGYNLFESNKF